MSEPVHVSAVRNQVAIGRRAQFHIDRINEILLAQGDRGFPQSVIYMPSLSCNMLDSDVAAALARIYKAQGWVVEYIEHDPDRAYKEVYFSLKFSMPAEPVRGGPDDR